MPRRLENRETPQSLTYSTKILRSSSARTSTGLFEPVINSLRVVSSQNLLEILRSTVARSRANGGRCYDLRKNR